MGNVPGHFQNTVVAETADSLMHRWSLGNQKKMILHSGSGVEYRHRTLMQKGYQGCCAGKGSHRYVTIAEPTVPSYARDVSREVCGCSEDYLARLFPMGSV